MLIRSEGIACDFSPRGWLYLAHNEREERGICDEITLAAQHGERFEIWSRQRIREEFGFRTQYLGRFVPGDGTYHPFKYTCGLLHRAVRAGVELHTHVTVHSIASEGANQNRLGTSRGSIVVRRVIVATNAFTSQILPELRAIRPYQGQIMVTENVADRTRGRVVTTEYGPTFFNQPRTGLSHGRAPLLMGGGPDRPMRNPASRRRSPGVHQQLLRLRDLFYPELHGQPPSAEWVGPMGFTPDQLPAIGFLRLQRSPRPGIVVAAGFNGYGGSYTTAAGEAAAQMVLTDTVPDWVPEDVFSPQRLLSDQPLFLGAHESLWRIAESLCHQLRAVERQLVETVGDSSEVGPPRAAPAPAVAVCTPSGTATSALAATLRALPLFRQFSHQELVELVQLMRCWEAPTGVALFAEGDPGGTCYVVVSGAIDVSSSIGGRQRVLARLVPGSIFGQVSLIDAATRSATCSVRRDAVLLELEREPCAQLFASRSPMALKFLSALNQGLIVALRGADRRLMRVSRSNSSVGPAPEATGVAERYLFD